MAPIAKAMPTPKGGSAANAPIPINRMPSTIRTGRSIPPTLHAITAPPSLQSGDQLSAFSYQHPDEYESSSA
jgi:hypothetical protein